MLTSPRLLSLFLAAPLALVAYVDAAGNPQANELARQIADRDAVSFRCKKDRAKTYGKSLN